MYSDISLYIIDWITNNISYKAILPMNGFIDTIIACSLNMFCSYCCRKNKQTLTCNHNTILRIVSYDYT